MKRKNKRWQVILLSVLSLIIIFGVGVYATTRSNSEQTGQASQNEIINVAGQVNGLYYDKAYTFLKENITAEAIDEAKQAVATITNGSEKDQLTERLTDVQERYNALSATNKLFKKVEDKAPLNGATLQEYVVINKETKVEDINKVRDTFENQLGDQADGFYETIYLLLIEANDQVEMVADLEAEIKTLKDNEDLDYTDLIKALDDLRKQNAKIENPYIKAELLNIISKADQDLTKLITKHQVDEAKASGKSEEEIEEIEAEGKKQQEESNSRVAKDTKESQAFNKTSSKTRATPNSRNNGQATSSKQSAKTQSQKASPKASSTAPASESSAASEVSSQSEASSTSENTASEPNTNAGEASSETSSQSTEAESAPQESSSSEATSEAEVSTSLPDARPDVNERASQPATQERSAETEAQSE